MTTRTKIRLAWMFYLLALAAPFVATYFVTPGLREARWRIIWLPNPAMFPPSIPIPVPV